MENENQQSTERHLKLPTEINANEVKKMLVEVLIPIEQDEKGLLEDKLKTLQEQIDKLGKKSNQVRVLWYVNDGTKTTYELHTWLTEMSNCVFYVMLNINEPIEDGYLKKLYQVADKMIRATNSCKMMKIQIKKNAIKTNQIGKQQVFEDKFGDY